MKAKDLIKKCNCKHAVLYTEHSVYFESVFDFSNAIAILLKEGCDYETCNTLIEIKDTTKSKVKEVVRDE